VEAAFVVTEGVKQPTPSRAAAAMRVLRSGQGFLVPLLFQEKQDEEEPAVLRQLLMIFFS